MEHRVKLALLALTDDGRVNGSRFAGCVRHVGRSKEGPSEMENIYLSDAFLSCFSQRDKEQVSLWVLDHRVVRSGKKRAMKEQKKKKKYSMTSCLTLLSIMSRGRGSLHF